MNLIYSWDVQITLGKNEIKLPFPVLVKKGYFVYLTQNSGKLSIDTSGNSDYSDLEWKSNTWLSINKKSKWRIYLTPVINFTSYQSKLNIVRSYKEVGIYNLSITFLSSNQRFIYSVNITDCMY